MNLKKTIDDEVATHPEKVFWPEEGYTKGDLLQYYSDIAIYILPHLLNRPIVMNRYPDGIDGESFFQKEAPAFLPDWVRTVKIKHPNKTIHYILIDDVRSLLYVVNLGSIEINAFLSSYEYLDYPEILSIDLDPEDLPFEAVVEVALVTHQLLDQFNIVHCCKTSGKRGLHIYLPLKDRYAYEQVAQFAKLLAVLIQERNPDLVSLVRDPKKRQKKVYVDFLQNSKTKTMVSPYSVRPIAHASVSTPLEWKELNTKLEPHKFDIKTVPKRLEKKGDLFKPLLISKGIDIEAFLKELSSL
jgi:bifunctional non-homologous end joining protein LigD